MAEKLELTHLMISEHQKHIRKEKRPKRCSIVAPRRGDLAGCFSQIRIEFKGRLADVRGRGQIHTK